MPATRRNVVEVADDRLTQRVATKLKADRYSVLTVSRNEDGVRAICDDLIDTRAP